MQYLKRKEVLIPLLITFVLLFGFMNKGIRALYYNERGVHYLRAGDLEKADKLLNAAIRVDPWYPVSYYNLGLVYRMKGDDESAIELFTRALDGHPDFYMARLDLARTLAKMGRLEEAKSELRKLAAIPAFKSDVASVLAGIRSRGSGN